MEVTAGGGGGGGAGGLLRGGWISSYFSIFDSVSNEGMWLAASPPATMSMQRGHRAGRRVARPRLKGGHGSGNQARF